MFQILIFFFQTSEYLHVCHGLTQVWTQHKVIYASYILYIHILKTNVLVLTVTHHMRSHVKFSTYVTTQKKKSQLLKQFGFHIKDVLFVCPYAWISYNFFLDLKPKFKLNIVSRIKCLSSWRALLTPWEARDYDKGYKPSFLLTQEKGCWHLRKICAAEVTIPSVMWNLKPVIVLTLQNFNS